MLSAAGRLSITAILTIESVTINDFWKQRDGILLMRLAPLLPAGQKHSMRTGGKVNQLGDPPPAIDLP